MTKIQDISTRHVSTSRLRSKMIHETEDDLNQASSLRRHANGRGTETSLRHTKAGAARKPTPESNGKMCRNRVGTFVEVSGNEHGHLDEFLICNLRLRLQKLLLNAQDGDIVLDVTQLRSVNTGFSQLVHEVSQNLAAQGRHILLFNERNGFSEGALDTGS